MNKYAKNGKLVDMKKLRILLLITVTALIMGACGNEIPELSDEELYMVEEYAAKLLLKYDANYSGTTLSDEEEETLRAEAEKKAIVRAKAEEERRQIEQKAAEQKQAFTTVFLSMA